ncbi:juvenile hormone acid O-methyltransferase-like [Centruroides sculpturatus]|uniref:juvenile hormone acid O-methyltransferase-like n=1 Tax=Centruroides sculpturatus TaxID=218467 RepID=UPI000C6D51E4|nr:juvenile hormone acid O-methyltransferase-like [Centruroides sculpturatus]
MNNPELYAKSNPFQLRDAKMVLSSFAPQMEETTDTDSILDIGCGVGNVTNTILRPIFSKYRRIIGVDKSTEMVDFARRHNAQDKIAYERLDICEDVENFKNTWGCFSKIFSFYCLHWIKDHRKVLKNIDKLLSTNGECLLVFVAQCPVFELYEIMATLPKWKNVMNDVENFIPDTQHSLQPVFDFSKLMKESGLEVLSCETMHMEFTFNSIDILKNCVCAISPFVSRIPEHDKESYISDSLKILSALATHERDANDNEGYGFSYKLMIARGRKL